MMFSAAAVVSVIKGTHDLFDGFLFFTFTAIVLSLTAGLAVTYPAAYLTQRMLGSYIRNSGVTGKPA
jgi:hypothetical protein